MKDILVILGVFLALHATSTAFTVSFSEAEINGSSRSPIVPYGNNPINDINNLVVNFANETRLKFYQALFNVSKYLPLSIEYAITVGHNCNIVEYNRDYYGPPGLVISGFLFIIGVLFCFIGYRLIKVNLFLIGFLVAGLLTYFILIAFIGNFDPPWKLYVVIAVSVVVAVIAGIITILIYYIGMFLAGGTVGFLATWFILSAIDIEFFQTHIYIPILISLGIGIICGIFTLIFQKWLIIFGTSIIGGFMMMWGVDYFVELGQMMYFLFLFALHRSTLNLCWYSWAILGLFPVVAIAGFIIQACVTGRKYNHKDSFDGICCGARKRCRKKKESGSGRYMVKIIVSIKDVLSSFNLQPLKDMD
jgi:hypothetical protein